MKLIVGAFVIGGTWVRLEYKMDESFSKMLKRIDEHILADRYEKQILQTQISELNNKLSPTDEYVDAYNPKKFIRPEDTERKTEPKRKRSDL